MADKLKAGVELDENSIKKEFGKVEKQGKKTGKALSKSMGKAFAGLGKSLTSVTGQVIGLGAAFASAFAIKKVIQAANQQEDAINSLNSALQITGKFSQAASQDLQDFASGLQQVTKFGDESILEAQALIQSLGNLSKEGLKDATTATLDLAAALKIDLIAAATLVGKAATGEVGSFSRYGVAIKKAKNNADTFKNALTALQKKFGGAAQKELGTFGASTQQLSNTFGDLTEEIGFLITKNPVIIEGVSRLNTLFKKLGDNVKEGRSTFIEFLNDGVVKTLTAIQVLTKKVKEFIDEWKDVAQIAVATLLLGKMVTVLATLKIALSTLGVGALITKLGFLLNPITAIVAGVAALTVGMKSLADAAKAEKAGQPVQKRIDGIKEELKFLKARIAIKQKEANFGDGFLTRFSAKNDVENLLQRIGIAEEALKNFRVEKKKALITNSEDKSEIISESTSLIDELKELFSTKFEFEDNKRPIEDAITLDEDKKESIKESYANLFGFLKISFDNTAKTMKKTGLTIAAQFKSGLVNGIVTGVQTIVSNIMNGQNAFANFGKIILQVIGDMATKMGATLIAAGIGIDSLKALHGAQAIAAGIGLVALGQVIKSFVGGGSGGVDTSIPGGGTVGAGVQDDDITSVADEEERQSPTTIVANINGPILDKRESGLAIVDILQEVFDEEGVVVRQGAFS